LRRRPARAALPRARLVVEAVDGAAAGLDFARREAAARGLQLSLRQADADALTFANTRFDYVLSWNVIFHGTTGDVGRRLAEIWRILKPGGLYHDAVGAARFSAAVWSTAGFDRLLRATSAVAHC
jgi:ubiquinone/menaquinone biosynthesis C-methylase UbiE